MKKELCCAIFGHSPMRFAWGFDEEDEGCRALKLELLQLIMELRLQGFTRFAVVCDCGIGLYAGEMVNHLRETDEAIQLYCVTPHEEQATKWAPYLRERYFALLERCTVMEVISPQKTLTCQVEAYRKIIDYADFVVMVYDKESVRGDAIDSAVSYAVRQPCRIICIHPDTLLRI